MKKIIMFICICLCLCCGNKEINAVPSFEVTITDNVEGVVGSSLSNPEVVLSVDPSIVIFNDAMIGEDVTSWFTNIPSDCNFTAEISDIDDDGATCYVQFSGDIEKTAEPITQDIEATIISSDTEPYLLFSYLNDPIDPTTDYYDGDVEVTNGGAQYIITEVFNIQYDGPYTVSGYVGEELTPQVVKVEITTNTDKFYYDNILNAVLSTPNGLTATVTQVPDNKHITITYTGTPIAPSQELIHTTIDKGYMEWNAKDRVVADRADVKFDIIERPPVVPDVPTYTPPVTGVE